MMKTEKKNREITMSIWKPLFFVSVALLALTPAYAKGKAPKPTTVNLQNGQGQSVGTATLSPATNGVKIKLNLQAKATLIAPNVTLGDDPHSVFTGGGTALVVHAKADDGKTDPSGNSGDRIACGVIAK